MEWVCFNCRLVQYEDELGTQTELMDRSVPGSYQTWTVCGRCGSDELAELSPEEIFEFFKDLTASVKSNRDACWARAARLRFALDLELLEEMVERFYG